MGFSSKEEFYEWKDKHIRFIPMSDDEDDIDNSQTELDKLKKENELLKNPPKTENLTITDKICIKLTNLYPNVKDLHETFETIKITERDIHKILADSSKPDELVVQKFINFMNKGGVEERPIHMTDGNKNRGAIYIYKNGFWNEDTPQQADNEEFYKHFEIEEYVARLIRMYNNKWFKMVADEGIEYIDKEDENGNIIGYNNQTNYILQKGWKKVKFNVKRIKELLRGEIAKNFKVVLFDEINT